MGDRESGQPPHLEAWHSSSNFTEDEAYQKTLPEVGQYYSPSQFHQSDNENDEELEEEADQPNQNEELEDYNVNNEDEQENNENDEYETDSQYSSDSKIVDEIVSCPNTDKVRTTDMTSTHLQPRDDLSRDKSGKRKFTPSLKVVKQHAIPLTSTHRRKWHYKQYSKDNEFEQSKHFKLCQRDIEHEPEQVLIHHAAYQFALTTIREPF